MLYLSGIFALNVKGSLETCGDWHSSLLNWNSIELVESEDSFFKDWGIERGIPIPERTGKFNVANTLRAVLDLMLENRLSYLSGFRNNFFGTDIYDKEFFDKVLELRFLNHWDEIDSLMKIEFRLKWDVYVKIHT